MFALWWRGSGSLISLKYGVHVCIITTSKYVTKLALLWPPSDSLSSLDHDLQILTIMAPKCLQKLSYSPPRSALLSSLDHGHEVSLQICLIVAFKFVRLWLPSAFPLLLDHSYHVHLQTRSIMACRGMSKFTRWWPASESLSLHKCHFQVHLEFLPTTVCSLSKCTMCSCGAILIHTYIDEITNRIHVLL